jgi:colanic acid biosynthesis glycosyl transferase WcaI
VAAPSPRGVRPKRVVFVNRFFHPDESATSRLLSDLAFRLADCGMNVVIVTSRQLYEDPGARLPPYEVIRGVEVRRIAGTSFGRRNLAGRALDYATFHLGAALMLARVLHPGDLVVAKTDPPLISVVVSWVARWRGASLVNWLQDLFPEVAAALAPGAIPNWLQSALASARDRSLRAATVNVVIGDRMATRVAGRGIDPHRIRIIPNWADCAAVTPLDAHRSLTRARLGLLDRFVIGYSGNFGRAHEFDTLFAAARLLVDDPQIAFLMTGGGAKLAPLQDAIERAGLRSFHFQGYQSADLLSDSMAAADVHLVSLLPAVEALIVPSKVYSILAAGRPMVFIGDPEGEISRLIRQHDCGIAVAIGDGQGLADALRHLQADPARCARLATNARQLALERYGADRAAADWLELLNSV